MKICVQNFGSNPISFKPLIFVKSYSDCDRCLESCLFIFQHLFIVKTISIISKKSDSNIMKNDTIYDDFQAQNIQQVWKQGSKVRYDDRLTP